MPGQNLYASYTSIYKPTLKTNADNSYLAPEVGKKLRIGLERRMDAEQTQYGRFPVPNR